jgi:hypothetical protein
MVDELEAGYTYTSDDFPTLLLRRFFPERTDGESAVIKAYLLAHAKEFDRITFSKRVGRGADIDPTTSPATQRATAFSTKKRIDILAWRGNQPVIVEVKQSVTPAALGQILTYRHHFLEENPDAADPELVVVGRTSDTDTIQALTAHSVTVYLYPEAVAGGAPTGGRV